MKIYLNVQNLRLVDYGFMVVKSWRYVVDFLGQIQILTDGAI